MQNQVQKTNPGKENSYAIHIIYNNYFNHSQTSKYGKTIYGKEINFKSSITITYGKPKIKLKRQSKRIQFGDY